MPPAQVIASTDASSHNRKEEMTGECVWGNDRFYLPPPKQPPQQFSLGFRDLKQKLGSRLALLQLPELFVPQTGWGGAVPTPHSLPTGTQGWAAAECPLPAPCF
jgi:hypothetical protein